MEQEWNPLTIEDVAERFAPFDVDWWIAGGQAIDLFLGWESRRHADLDLEMFRSDREILFDVFKGWELFTVSEGAHSRWLSGAPIEAPVFGIWGRPSSSEPWGVEIMLADGDATEWRFRRDPSIRMNRSRLTHTLPSGVKYCAPEVQLLYKSKQARPKDDVDFTRTLHLMNPDQKLWLCNAVRRTSPGHPWIVALERASE